MVVRKSDTHFIPVPYTIYMTMHICDLLPILNLFILPVHSILVCKTTVLRW